MLISPIPVAAATNKITVTLGETVDASKLVYVELNGGSGTAGRAYLADKDSNAKCDEGVILGFTVTGGDAGDEVQVQYAGVFENLSSLTAGAIYYVGDAGAVTSSEPSNAQIIGIALSTTAIVIAQRNLGATLTATAPDSTATYFLGGRRNGGDGTHAGIDKTVVSTDTTSNMGFGLSAGKMWMNGCSNTLASYLMGGYDNTGHTNEIEKLAHTDSLSMLAATLGSVVESAAAGQSNTHGYSLSGHNGSGRIAGTTKLAFSNETSAAGGNVQNPATEHFAAEDDSILYLFGGTPSWYGNFIATADKYTFATDTCAVGENLPTAKSRMAALAHYNTAAYYYGGNTWEAAYDALAFKMPFSTGIPAACSGANLGGARSLALATAADTTKGYIVGGQWNVGDYFAEAYTTVFATDTTSATASANLSQARSYGGATSNGGL